MENKLSGRISSCRTRYGKRQPECGSAHSNKGPSCRFSSAFMCSVLGLAKQQHKPLPCTSHSFGGRGYFKRAHAVASQAPYMWPEYPQINNFRTLAQTSLRYFKQRSTRNTCPTRCQISKGYTCQSQWALAHLPSIRSGGARTKVLTSTSPRLWMGGG